MSTQSVEIYSLRRGEGSTIERLANTYEGGALVSSVQTGVFYKSEGAALRDIARLNGVTARTDPRHPFLIFTAAPNRWTCGEVVITREGVGDRLTFKGQDFGFFTEHSQASNVAAHRLVFPILRVSA